MDVPARFAAGALLQMAKPKMSVEEQDRRRMETALKTARHISDSKEYTGKAEDKRAYKNARRLELMQRGAFK